MRMIYQADNKVVLGSKMRPQNTKGALELYSSSPCYRIIWAGDTNYSYALGRFECLHSSSSITGYAGLIHKAQLKSLFCRLITSFALE